MQGHKGCRLQLRLPYLLQHLHGLMERRAA
ncbi:hypothetical protein MED193_19704 [Roseobacter sp. MED193]|nr:hypothetical protein MED193_19704 [Roseobacter sp. MED193]